MGAGRVAGVPVLPAIADAEWRELDRDRPRDGEESLEPVAEFVREQVDLTLTGREVEVWGRYTFRNPLPRPTRLGITYPFPVGPGHPYPHAIDAGGLDVTELPAGIGWRLDLDACEERTVEVRYRQACETPEATYILTSTRAWGRPIELAEFTLRYPESLGPLRVSYPADAGGRSVSAGVVTHRFARRSFWPSADLVARW
jgi:hypothetical protein